MRVFITILCLVLCQTGSANSFPEKYEERILLLMLDLHFDEADSLLEISSGQSKDPAWFYLDNYLGFLEAIIAGDIESYKKYQEESAIRIDDLSRSGSDESISSLYLSSIHLQSSVLSAYHQERLQAAVHFYRSWRYLNNAACEDEYAVMWLRNRAMVNMGLASVPEDYSWLLSIFGMKGDLEEGRNHLKESIELSQGAGRLESLLIWSLLGTFSRDTVAFAACRSAAPDTLTLGRYIQALRELSSGNSRGVVALLKGYEQEPGERDLVYLDLLLGEALLNGLDSGAGKALKSFLSGSKSPYYNHLAYHKLSWHFLLLGDRENYQSARQEVLNLGPAIREADRQALTEAMETSPVNIPLLKTRLLYDGGFYAEALQEMEIIQDRELINLRDSVEYTYRLGRLMVHFGNMERATRLYELTLHNAEAEDWYFAPNAALQLGIISEQQGDSNRAVEYYKKCILINRSAYKHSINLKASQGIRRLGE